MNDLGISTLRRPWFIIHLAADKSTTRIPFRLPPPRWCSAINRISDHYQDRLPHVPAPDSKALRPAPSEQNTDFAPPGNCGHGHSSLIMAPHSRSKKKLHHHQQQFPRLVYLRTFLRSQICSRAFSTRSAKADDHCGTYSIRLEEKADIFRQIGRKSKNVPSDWMKKQTYSISSTPVTLSDEHQATKNTALSSTFNSHVSRYVKIGIKPFLTLKLNF